MYTVNVVETTFLTGAAYTFWSFILAITLFKGRDVVNNLYPERSNEHTCWTELWTSKLVAMDILKPPHKTLGDLYSDLSGCDTSDFKNPWILDKYLDETMQDNARNYLVALVSSNLLAHWGLRTIAFVLTTLRQPLEDYDLSNLILRVHASLTMVPRKERQPVSQLFVWIEESVRHAVYEGLYTRDQIPDDATKPLPYLPIFTKKGPYIAGMIIAFAFSIATQLICSYPGESAVFFMIKFGETLYGGPFWTTIISGGVWMVIAVVIGFLLMPGFEWALLISCVYEPARNFQRSNSIRMNLIQSIIDPDVHVKAYNAYNMRILVYIR